MKKLLIGCLLNILTIALCVESGEAAPGDPDTSFGQSGFSLIQIRQINNLVVGHRVAIQSDNRIIVVGTTADSFASADFVLARLNADGTMDSTFGDGGVVTTSFDAFNNATGLAIQSDGKIVVAGFTAASDSESSPRSLALARYTPSGSLDASFGNGGKVTVSLGVGGAVRSMVIQSGGRILVAGTVVRPGSGADFVVVRFLSSGAPDTSFGSTGFPNLSGAVTTDFGGQDQAFAVALLRDDKIVVAGCTQATTPIGDSDFAVARYSASGILDNTFGSFGRVTTDFSTSSHGCFQGALGDLALGIAQQADGKIVVVGSTQKILGLATPALVRYNVNGTLDTTFGSGGKVDTAFGDAGRAVVVQPDGKIVIAAGAGTTNGHCCQFGLARFTTNGSLDNTFGRGGTVATNATGERASALAIQQLLLKGEIVVAGDSNPVAFCDRCIAVARLDAFTISRTRVGTFALAPAESIQAVHRPFLYSFTWTVPATENWHNLKTLALRIRDATDSIVTVVFDEASNSFSLLNEATGRSGPSASPGSQKVLETRHVKLYLADSEVVAAGPTSPVVTLNMSLELKPQTAGQSFRVEVAASDDQGNDTRFVRAGTLKTSSR